MSDQSPPTEDSRESNAGLPPAEVPKATDTKASQPATAQQLEQVEKQMSSFEKTTLRWAKLAVCMSGVAALFVCLQWYEMHEGGADTHTLAQAAKESADAAHLSAEALRPRLAIIGLTPAPRTADGLPIDSGKLHVQFQVPNYGPSAAQSTEFCEFDEISPPDKITRIPYENCKSSAVWGYGNSIIPPVTELNGMQPPGWGMDGSRTLTESDVAGLKQPGTLEAVFSILATYDDAAGKVHHSEACIIFTFQQKWGTQTIGNWGSEPCQWETTND